MKIVSVVSLFLAFNVVALAKPNPVERLRVAFENADINIDAAGDEKTGFVGAMRERNYFFAPLPQFNAGVFPCRLEPILFHKTRLAQSCP